jgi:5-formyltetrahydrofolate cyclo-ligase
MLRREVRSRRDEAPADARESMSMAISRQMIALPTYQQARCIHAYLPFGSEVNIRPVIQHAFDNGKRVMIPLFIKGSSNTPCVEISSLNPDDYCVGDWGLLVPKDLHIVPIAQSEMLVVPLLGFSRLANGIWRLGYGIGYYDRLLNACRDINVENKPKAIGVAFSFQQLASFPVEDHDEPLDDVITEAGFS